MHPQLFLKTKLLPPRLGTRNLPRARLIARLRGFLDHPATVICADAGCGKTTVAAEFVRASDHPFVWYQIDRSDLDPTVFFSYLTYGIRNVYESFGETVLALIRRAERVPPRANQLCDQLCDELINEIIEHVEQKIIVVLDDLHHVGLSGPVNAGIGRLIERAPDVLHIILTTRSMHNLPVRSKDLVAILGRQELYFTQEEVKQLFDRIAGCQFDERLIAQTFERTRGWATGIQLIAQAAEHIGQRGDQVESDTNEILKRGEEELFNYFAEEVLQCEAPETQDSLLKLSLFRSIDHAAACCVLPAGQASQLLTTLQHSNLFLTQVEGADEIEFTLHPMFRSFLRRRISAELGEEGLRKLENQYADQLMEAGKCQSAVRMYVHTRNSDALVGILIERGCELLDAGLFEIVKRAYEAVADAATDLHPEIRRVRAHIAQVEGDLELAERQFAKAAIDARKISDTRCEALSLHGLSVVYLKRGEHTRAFPIATEALAKSSPDDLVLRAQCEHAIGNCQFMSSIDKGEFEQAIETWGRAARLARQAGNEILARTISLSFGIPYAFTGDTARAREWFSQLFEGEAGRVPRLEHAAAYCNLGRTDLASDELDSCERNIAKAFEVCSLFNLTLERAEAHEIAGCLDRDRGRFHAARDHFLQAENFYREAGIPLESCELPEEQVRLLLAEKNISKARDSAAELLERRIRLGGAFQIARARLLLGQALLESAGEDASDLLHKALDGFIECRAITWIASARFLLARLEIPAGDESAAEKNLAEALRISREFSCTRDIDLTINMLGPFEVLRDHDRKLAPDAWTLSRALRILCFIASRRDHRATKDSIIETFWPDSLPEDIDKNFWPTISYIRRALNSNQDIKKNFIRYREGAYYLNPQFSYSIDSQEFDRLIALSQSLRSKGDSDASAAAARSAVELYRGDFLEEVYDNWIEDRRKYYQSSYLTTLKELADHHHRAGQYEESIAYCKMILNRDAYREDVHRKLMDSYAHTGNRAALREQYENLITLLREELGVDPLRETIATYERLVAGL